MNKNTDIKKKSKRLEIRLSPKDYDNFKSLCKECNVTMSEVLVGDIKHHINKNNTIKIYHREKEMIEMLDYHIGRVGNNLNQTTKALNIMNKTGEYNGMPPFEDIRKRIFACQKMYESLQKVLAQLI